MAHRRHGQEIAAEKSHRRSAGTAGAGQGLGLGGGLSPSTGLSGTIEATHSTPYSNLSNAEMKEVLKKLTDTIGYVEFFKVGGRETLLMYSVLPCIPIVGDSTCLFHYPNTLRLCAVLS